MNTTRRILSNENLVDSDRVIAEREGERAAVEAAVELAPLSYAAMKAANAERRLGELLADLADDLVRPQAVRFLAERGLPWSWGDVDEVERRFRRLVNEHRQATFDELVEGIIARLRKLAACHVAPAPAEPTTITVASSKGDGTTYQVAIDGSACTCKGFFWRHTCRHATEQAEAYEMAAAIADDEAMKRWARYGRAA
jgi:hypothetical protein